jgi:uncharacterized protein YbjT (DUF2867 family)
MILITGAGGKTGKALIKVLSKVESVCAFVHREEHVSVAKSLGAEKVIVSDMRDEAAIRSSMQSVRAIYHMCPNMSPDEVLIGKLVISAARESGVEHFVYHSVLHPQTEKMKHHWQKLRVEEMLFESELPFTILQPAPYMQNLLAGWKSIVEDGVLRVPYSVNSKFSFIDLEDIAEAAKIVLTEPNHKNAMYELAGTSPMSHVEVAEVFSHVLKRDVWAEKEEISNWRLRAERSERSSRAQSTLASGAYSPWVQVPGSAGERAGMSEYAVENLVKMFEYYDQWGLVGNPNVLKWLLRREPTSVDAFLARALKEHDNI